MSQASIARSKDTVPLLLVMAGAAIILLVTLLLPLGFDNDLYESMGWALYAYHALPYLGSWDHNFPGIVFVHWASIALFGASDFGFRLFDYLVHIAMAGFYYRVLRNWLSPRTAVLAVLLFVLYYASGQWGLAGQRDTYAAFLLLCAVFAFVKLRDNRSHAGWFSLIVGFLCGATFLMRPTYIFFAITFLILLLGLPNKFRIISSFFIGCFLPIVAFLLPYLFIQDGLVQVYDTIIRFNLDVYSSVSVPINLWSRGRAPIFIGSVVGLFFVLREQRGANPTRDRTMFLLLTASALISPIMMGKYFTYHFEPLMLLAIPFAAIGLNRLTIFIPIRFIGNAATVLILLVFAYFYYPHHLFRYSVEARKTSAAPLEATYERVLSDSLYGIAAEQEVVQYVDRVVPLGELIETVSIFSGLRWRLHRPAATRFTSVVPLSAYSYNIPAYSAAWRREFIHSIEKNAPQVVIVSKSNQWWPFVGKTNDSAIASIPGFESLIASRYSLDTVIRGFALYRIRK